MKLNINTVYLYSMVSFHFVTCQVMRKPAFSFREIQARIGCAIAQVDWRFYLSVPLWLKVLCQCTALCFAWSKTSKAGLLMTWLTSCCTFIVCLLV